MPAPPASPRRASTTGGRASTTDRPSRPDAPPAPARRRVNDILLGRFERWALPRMAARMPRWVTPDTLTYVALGASALTGVAYALAGETLAWLHLASVGIVLHWWGDSLDGTLARVRDIRRERYGFFFDHLCDAVSVVFLSVGIGAGGLLRMDVALAIGGAVLLLMVLIHLVTIARDVFKISFGGVGPTELRVLGIGLNTAAWAAGPPRPLAWAPGFTAYDVGGLVLAGVLLAFFAVTAVRETRTVSRLDPTPTRGLEARPDVPGAGSR